MNHFKTYWGKAEKNSSAFHPLAYHSLDVAAVGWRLLGHQPSFLKEMSDVLSVETSTVKGLLAWLISLHDLGKFSFTFQGLRPDLMDLLQRGTNNRDYSIRHDQLGSLVWMEDRKGLFLKLHQGGWLGGTTGNLQNWKTTWGILVGAVFGHHGTPTANDRVIFSEFFLPDDLEAAWEYTQQSRDIFLEQPIVFSQSGTEVRAMGPLLKRLSWQLAGLTVLSDWLGSNTEYFPFCPPDLSLKEYWENKALPGAEKALAESGVLPVSVCSQGGFQHLFADRQASPLQHYADSQPLHSGPQMFLLEDLTGSGKTEAAMTLVSRLMTEGGAEGLFFGLPTQATANAMYERMAPVYQRLFAPDTKPSLVLAHSNRDWHPGFRGIVLAETKGGMGAYDKEAHDETASAMCAAWLADNRKRSLLAQVGVGTIDQALLSILPTKHQALRLLGLGSKVLVVDEVHAFDAYMHTLLKNLLAFHAALGGSAILLSATLPQNIRQELANAFAAGFPSNSEDTLIHPLTSTAYPLATQVGADGCHETPVETRNGAPRKVTVTFVHSMGETVSGAAAQAKEGKCVCWIRNTVGDALEAYEALKVEVGPDRVLLFHARFAMGDRLAIERQVLSFFGPKSRPEDRHGRILVATQVVEQSLDLDFDEMISDLAPVELLIQRAGRLKRHARDAKGNFITDLPDGRTPPVLTVLAPLPVDNPDAGWYSAVFPKAAWVYPSHGQLWVAARLLQQKGGWQLPQDARALMEGVYGPGVLIPPGLSQRDAKAETQAKNDITLAWQHTLRFQDGYSVANQPWQDDLEAFTRLGKPQTTVRLARWDGTHLTPWINEDADLRANWHHSQLSVNKYRIAQEAPPRNPALKAAWVQAKESMPDKGKYGVLVALVPAEDGLWLGQAVNKNGKEVSLIYSETFGLRWE